MPARTAPSGGEKPQEKVPATRRRVATAKTPEAIATWAQAVVQRYAPEIADILGVAGFPNISINMDMGTDPGVAQPGAGWASEGTINLSYEYMRHHPLNAGLIVHEAAHVIMAWALPGMAATYDAKSDWLYEGIAEYVKNRLVPGASSGAGRPRSGYGNSADFLAWLEQRKPGTIKLLFGVAAMGQLPSVVAKERVLGAPLADLITAYRADRGLPVADPEHRALMRGFYAGTRHQAPGPGGKQKPLGPPREHKETLNRWESWANDAYYNTLFGEIYFEGATLQEAHAEALRQAAKYGVLPFHVVSGGQTAMLGQQEMVEEADAMGTGLVPPGMMPYTPGGGPLPEVRKQTGTATQLPQGGAQQVNQALAALPQNQAAQTAVLPPIEYAPERGRARTGGPADEDEQILFAPTERRGEPITAGIGPRGKGPLPADLWTWLPALIDAAVDPTAPPQLKALVELIASRIERG